MSFAASPCHQSDCDLFGKRLRDKYFTFDPAYLPLNHGSYGAFPATIRDYQRQLQDNVERRSDPYIRFEIPKLINKSRRAVAELLGAPIAEVALIPNATTAVNTVLRNLVYESQDVILNFSFAYGACEKTIHSVCEATGAEQYCIQADFPLEDEELVHKLRSAVSHLQREGKRAKICMFDTVVTFPGVRLPWENLVAACRELGVLSLIDGAHGVGHIDLRHLTDVSPDFFTSNCYKWLYTPRPCAVFFVPARNHHLISTSLPTSHGWIPRNERPKHSGAFAELFKWVATVDQTPYCCVAEAVAFRTEFMGGEDRIRDYCYSLASRGGELVAQLLGTEVMQNATQSMNKCCFTNIRLPLKVIPTPELADNAIAEQDVPEVIDWIMKQLKDHHNTWIPGKLYNGQAWMRFSAQTYLDLDDFRVAARILLDLCDRVERGEWKTPRATL